MTVTNTCGDYDIKSVSLRAGDGLADWVKCGGVATHLVGGTSFVCDEHMKKRRDRGDDMSKAVLCATPVSRNDSEVK